MTGPLRCRPPAIATMQLDNAHLRVTRRDFLPGSETGWHRHGMG
jgi:quercetin dioxygenase-like cupin family protein